MAFANPSASPVWPPTAIAFAAFLVLGYRVWPAIFLGAFLVNATTTGGLLTSAGIAVGNTLEGVAGAWLTRRWAGGCRAFERAQGVFAFAVLAGGAAATISATAGVTSLALGGYAPWADYGSIWRTWWQGDATAAVVVTPALLLWSAQPRVDWSSGRALEAGLLGTTLLMIAAIVFQEVFPWRARVPQLDFLLLPVLVWAAYRFGPREAATAVLLVCSIAVSGTARRFGPFAGQSPNESLMLLQAYMGVVALTTTVLAAVVSERRRAEEELRRAHDELEGQVRRRTEELHRSNDELKQFAQVVSHDLQEPLRMVSSFVQLLGDRYRDRLDQDAREFIGFAVGGARRMHELIQALLAYARLDTARPFSLVSCQQALALGLANLRLAIQESGAAVVHEPLPDVLGDPTQLAQLFQNLVGNAIKFRRQDAAPRVEIGVEPDGADCVFSVRDNGIGIDPRYAEQVFVIFKRLSPGGEARGAGIGLAICKKIVERHHGRIWVESRPGQGSVFRFTLRRAAAGGGGRATRYSMASLVAQSHHGADASSSASQDMTRTERDEEQ